MMKYFKLFFVLIALALAGCNGQDESQHGNVIDGGDVTPPVVAPYDGTLKAMDLSLSAPLRKTILSLKPYVWSKARKSLSLVDVKSLSKGCAVTDQVPERLTFEAEPEKLGVCLFRYTVTDQKQQASATLRLVVSPNGTGARLMPLPVGNRLGDINKNASLGDVLSFDLSVEPEIATAMAGMTNPRFSEDTIIYGSGSVELTEAGRFTYQAIASGLTEVAYFILDDQNTIDNPSDDEVYAGRVLISVSGNDNAPPTADDGVLTTPLKPGEEVEIDVADFADATGGSLIGDSDTDPVQLVYVQSDGAFVELSKPNDVTNTKFKLQAPTTPGEGYKETIVHYAVYDHNEDGVAHGVISVTSGKRLTGITISPKGDGSSGVTSLSIAKGRRQGFVAVGTFDDGIQEDVTTDVTWTSSNPSVVTITATGVARGRAKGHTDISASITSMAGTSEANTLDSNAIDLAVTDAELVKFWLTPARQSLPLGATGDLTATGLYSDGTTASISDVVTWTVTPSRIASIDNTVVGTSHPAADVHADNKGDATITATFDGGSALNEAKVTVTDAEVDHVQLTVQNGEGEASSATQIEMAVGQEKKLRADAVYTDGSVVNVTEYPATIWESKNDTIADFTTPALPFRIEGLAVGETQATASYGGKISNPMPVIVSPARVKSIQVTPPSLAMHKGERYSHLIATATMTDGNTQDITADASWISTNTVAVTVARGGEVNAIQVGNSNVTATYTNPGTTAEKTSNEVKVKVGKAIVTEVHITTTPDPVEIPAGDSKQLEAEAVYSDGETKDITYDAAWSTDSPSIASIASSGGLVTVDSTASVGSTTKATAELDGVSDSIGIKVTGPEITRIDVTPSNLMLPISTTQQYTAMATYSDGSLSDITHEPDTNWSTSDSTLAMIDSDGMLASTTKLGEVRVKAENKGVLGQTILTVVPVVLESIDADPPSVTLLEGHTAKLTATGTYSDGATKDITDLVDWTGHDTAIATVESKVGSNSGQVTGISDGTTDTTPSMHTDTGVNIKGTPALIIVDFVGPY
ncbi:Ig-like domain-containing protein, partial [Vibrio parahaemolyticus]|nr:Ig-like domain-containing protein [Vibrio parahaemolyticus]